MGILLSTLAIALFHVFGYFHFFVYSIPRSMLVHARKRSIDARSHAPQDKLVPLLEKCSKNARSLIIHCSIQIKCSFNARSLLVPLQIFARKMLREFLITSILRAIYEVSRAEKQQITIKKAKNLH